MAKSDHGPAAEAPGVGAALATYRNRGLLVVLVGVALLAVFVAAASMVQSEAERLEEVGERVDGTVVQVNAALRSAGTIHVEFVHRNQPRSSVIHLNDSSPRYEVGQPVTVLVDPADPAHVSLPGEKNQSRWTVVPMVLAFVGGGYAAVVGCLMLARVRRQRRLLRAHPWRPATSEFRFRHDNGTGPAAVRLAGDRLLVIASSLRQRIERSGVPTASQVEVAGDPSGYVVLRAPGSDILLSARPPRSSRSLGRWSNRFP